ncbi:MAG: LysR family transcriptional regulator [Nocardioidaceae bacterium]
MVMSLNKLEILVRVIEHGGFSAAAKAMYMSQPAVSNHIRGLESSLGVRLVERSAHGTKPTPAGEVIAGHARSVFALMEQIEHAAAEFQGLRAGRLTVAGTTTMGTYLLPQVVAEFSNRVPGVACQIRVGNEETVETWLMRGEVGIGVCVGEMSDEQLVAEPIVDENMVLVSTATSPLVGRALTPADLADQRFLMREMGSATRQLQEDVLDTWGLQTAERWDFWGPETLKEAVHQGLGLALLSEHATAREIGYGLLSALSIEPTPPTRSVCLVRRADRTFTPPEEAFVGLLRALSEWPAPRVAPPLSS